MGSTRGYFGSVFDDISILLLGCHFTDDELRGGGVPLRFLPRACIYIVLGGIMGARGTRVGCITDVVFLLPIP